METRMNRVMIGICAVLSVLLECVGVLILYGVLVLLESVESQQRIPQSEVMSLAFGMKYLLFALPLLLAVNFVILGVRKRMGDKLLLAFFLQLTAFAATVSITVTIVLGEIIRHKHFLGK